MLQRRGDLTTLVAPFCETPAACPLVSSGESRKEMV